MRYQRQLDESDCGPACLTMVASFYKLYYSRKTSKKQKKEKSATKEDAKGRKITPSYSPSASSHAEISRLIAIKSP